MPCRSQLILPLSLYWGVKDWLNPDFHTINIRDNNSQRQDHTFNRSMTIAFYIKMKTFLLYCQLLKIGKCVSHWRYVGARGECVRIRPIFGSLILTSFPSFLSVDFVDYESRQCALRVCYMHQARRDKELCTFFQEEFLVWSGKLLSFTDCSLNQTKKHTVSYESDRSH